MPWASSLRPLVTVLYLCDAFSGSRCAQQDVNAPWLPSDAPSSHPPLESSISKSQLLTERIWLACSRGSLPHPKYSGSGGWSHRKAPPCPLFSSWKPFPYLVSQQTHPKASCAPGMVLGAGWGAVRRHSMVNKRPGLCPHGATVPRRGRWEFTKQTTECSLQRRRGGKGQAEGLTWDLK